MSHEVLLRLLSVISLLHAILPPSLALPVIFFVVHVTVITKLTMAEPTSKSGCLGIRTNYGNMLNGEEMRQRLLSVKDSSKNMEFTILNSGDYPTGILPISSLSIQCTAFLKALYSITYATSCLSPATMLLRPRQWLLPSSMISSCLILKGGQHCL